MPLDHAITYFNLNLPYLSLLLYFLFEDTQLFLQLQKKIVVFAFLDERIWYFICAFDWLFIWGPDDFIYGVMSMPS